MVWHGERIPKDLRNQVGYSLEGFTLQDSSVEENLNFLPRFQYHYGKLLPGGRYLQTVRAFSDTNRLTSGIKPWLALWLRPPKTTVLFLDEPTTGLTPFQEKNSGKCWNAWESTGHHDCSTPLWMKPIYAIALPWFRMAKFYPLTLRRLLGPLYPDKFSIGKTDKMSNMIKALNQYEHALSCYILENLLMHQWTKLERRS